MFTLRVILIGLIALTPASQRADQQGKVALVVAADQAHPRVPAHRAWVVLWEGECEGRACADNGGRPFKDFSLAWNLEGHDLEIDTHGSVDRFEETRGDSTYDQLFPASPDEVADVRWIPGLSWLKGNASVRDDCMADVPDCPLLGRFHLDQGTLSTCHLVHARGSATEPKIYAYRLGTTRRAIANAVVFEIEVCARDHDEDHVSLKRTAFGDRDDTVSVRLRPSDENPDVVTLLVLNEPLRSACPLGDPPDDHKHFAAFHGLLKDPGTRHPVRQVDYKRMYPGSCEDELITLECCIGTEDCTTNPECESMFPHGPTECDVATIP